MVLGAFACLGERQAVYVSSPFTTGRLHIAWRAAQEGDGPESLGQLARYEHQVLGPNRATAKQFVDDLRRQLPGVVIDPLAFPDQIDWTQDDYRAMWADVVRRHASAVVFRTGWQCSSGCSFEFLVAVQEGLPLLNEDLNPFSVDDGVRLLREAALESQAQGVSSAFLEHVLAALGDIGSRRTGTSKSAARPGER
ncbi:MAG: hypothetical protein ABSD78_10475 [Acidimicrobiales bacterium]|jgi:hypothetical protein